MCISIPVCFLLTQNLKYAYLHLYYWTNICLMYNAHFRGVFSFYLFCERKCPMVFVWSCDLNTERRPAPYTIK